MQIDWWTLGLQALNALILIWILVRFLFRPVSEIMRKRQEAVAAILNEAEAAKAAARTAEERAESEAARLAQERGDVIEKASKEAEAARTVLLAKARNEADKIRYDAEASVVALRKKERADGAIHASVLAIDLAVKLLSRLPAEALIAGFIDGLGEGIKDLPEETKAGVGTNGDAVHLTVARALTDGESKACAAMLKKVLGRKIDFSVRVDPTLIAGLELQTPHALVKNSFRADLDRLKAELTTHD